MNNRKYLIAAILVSLNSFATTVEARHLNTSFGRSRATDVYQTNPETGLKIVPNNQRDYPRDPSLRQNKFLVNSESYNMEINCRYAKNHRDIARLCDDAFGDAWRAEAELQYQSTINEGNYCLFVNDMRLAINEIGAVQLMKVAGVWDGIPETVDGPKHVGPDEDNYIWNFIAHPVIPGAGAYQIARECKQSRLVSFGNSVLMSAIWEFFIEASKEHASTQDLVYTPVIGSIIGEAFYMFRLKFGDLSTLNPNFLQRATRILNLEGFGNDVANDKVGWGDADSLTGRWNLVYDVGDASENPQNRHQISTVLGIKGTFDTTRITGGCGVLDKLLGLDEGCDGKFRQRNSPPPKLKEICDPQASSCLE